MARLVVIGDVHGCLEELEALLARVRLAASDRVVFLGDLVDRGPESAAVVRLARTVCAANPGSTCLLGNHEMKLLRSRARRASGKPVELPAYAMALTDEDWTFLEGLPVFVRDRARALVLVHGGFFPKLFTVLADGRLPESAPRLDDLPRREADRYRCLAMVRDVDLSGNSIGDGEGASGTWFWADAYDGREGMAIFGHVPLLKGPSVFAHALGLDTGCVFGGALSAVVFHEEGDGAKYELVSEPARRVYFRLSGTDDEMDET